MKNMDTIPLLFMQKNQMEVFIWILSPLPDLLQTFWEQGKKERSVGKL